MPSPNSLLKGFARTVAYAKPDPVKRITIGDPDTRGLYLRITPKGQKTFTIVARNPAGKQIWREVGNVEDMDLEAAREKARLGVKRIKAGLEPFEVEAPPPPPQTFREVSEEYLRLHVRKEKSDEQLKRNVRKEPLRSTGEIERQFKKDIWPAFGDRPFVSITRDDVADLLDKIEERGPVMADRVLATLSKLFSWYAARRANYVSPIVRGMARTSPAERKRKRFLNDDEIRAVWNAAEGTFGAFVKILLLTGQRRSKVRTMKHEDVAEDGTWTIPAEAREKSNAEILKLPQMALDIINAQPVIKDNPYVFAGAGKVALNAVSNEKAALDKRAKIAPWVLHDLRRTAKTLMQRAKVDWSVSESILGHALVGVGDTYARYDFGPEKAKALILLSNLVTSILNPPEDNVIQLERIA